MTATAWSILPPIITIILALWTKEVYMSLIIGIFSGAMLFAGGNFLQATLTMFQVMADKVGGNVNILVFLVILGILVAAITRSGAMNAYGEWATRTIKGKRSASLVTVLLGIVIFIDDYFNCLTVGTVMRPVTDKFQIARTKLAYIMTRQRHRSASSLPSPAGQQRSARRSRRTRPSTASCSFCRPSRSTSTHGLQSSLCSILYGRDVTSVRCAGASRNPT